MISLIAAIMLSALPPQGKVCAVSEFQSIDAAGVGKAGEIRLCSNLDKPATIEIVWPDQLNEVEILIAEPEMILEKFNHPDLKAKTAQLTVAEVAAFRFATSVVVEIKSKDKVVAQIPLRGRSLTNAREILALK